jgi:YYY domain-containing protein
MFGNRMNTIFKVYYQVWAMLALASAYVLYYVASRRSSAQSMMSRWIGRVAIAAFAVLCLACLVYPAAGAVSRSEGFVRTPTLDGTAYLQRLNPSDYESIMWLQKSVSGTPVILEAVGGSYTEFARISANTGLPTVVGWPGHESQWRGKGDEAGQRQQDVETIYRTSDPEVARELLREYGVTYVYVGELERQTYGSAGDMALSKFGGFMDVAHQNAGAVIYRVRPE